PCKVPDEAFDAIDIRILERPARIGNIKVHFADGTAAVFWSDQAQALEPGEHRVGSFESKRRILRFDLRSQGEDGFYSRQTIVGVSHGG
ncbi:MAG: hypothetical protein JXQ29_00180, partial [Planctomycetes bacterium]|nr:hypothetical protein [Planctomycetota bacterium]